MFFDTRPAPIDDGMDDFRVAAPAEVLRLLKALMDGATTVHLSGPDGSHCASTVWTVDSARGTVSFSATAGDPQVERLVEAPEVTAVAYLDAVKLQFELAGLVLVRGASSCALQAAVPAELYRFQRRNTFRVRTLPRTAPVAHLRHPAMPEMRLSLRVVDVSTGGCALFLPDDVPPLPPGVRMQRVRIELDPNTRFEATVRLCHVTAINPGSGGTRLGCELHDLGGDAERALQRYIDQTQKRRRLLSLD